MIGVDAENALIEANKKFERRFRLMENLSKEDQVTFSSLPLDKMETYWKKAKLKEK